MNPASIYINDLQGGSFFFFYSPIQSLSLLDGSARLFGSMKWTLAGASGGRSARPGGSTPDPSISPMGRGPRALSGFAGAESLNLMLAG